MKAFFSTTRHSDGAPAPLAVHLNVQSTVDVVDPSRQSVRR